MRKNIAFGMIMFAAVLMAGCGKEKKNDPIEGKWIFESSVTVRINKENPSVTDSTVNMASDKYVSIREFKDNGVVYHYNEINPADMNDDFNDNIIMWDWKLSEDRKTLFLTNGRDSHCTDVYYGNHDDEVLVLNDKQLVTRGTGDDGRYKYLITSTYHR